MPKKDTETAHFPVHRDRRAPPRVVLVMGVSGSGKTVVGRRLADVLGWRFCDADDLHPPENVARMRSGTPLTDADREPWLRTLTGVVDEVIATRGPGLVLACSALKRAYRERLRVDDRSVRLVHLTGDETMIRARIAARTGHYMPASLLTSQLATLEPPGPDERPVVVDVSDPVDEVVAHVLARITAPLDG